MSRSFLTFIKKNQYKSVTQTKAEAFTENYVLVYVESKPNNLVQFYSPQLTRMHNQTKQEIDIENYVL